jgi:iron complex outermembrane receptor protein
VNNYIFYRKLESVNGGDSMVTIGGEDLVAFKYDQYDAKLTGLELNFDLHPHPLDWLHFENTLSVINGLFTEKIENTDNLPLMPAVRWVSEIRGNFKKSGKSFRNLYIKADMDWTFEQNKAFTAYNTETPTPGYALLHAGVGADIINKKEKTLLSIHFGGMNITNIAYQNHLSRLKYTDENLVTGRTGVFNAGRNYSLKLNIPLYFSFR